MSRMNDDEQGHQEHATAPALAALAAASREWRASPRVESAVLEAFDVLQASQPGASHGSRTPRSWTWAACGAVAASALTLVLWRVSTPAVGIDERPGEPVVVADAVPSGPLEPPPRPPVATPKADATRPDAGDAAPALAAAGGERATARRPAAGRRAAARQLQAVERDETEPFVWIPGADTIEPGLGLQVVRMRVPQARWEGRPPGSDAVEADVLMGEDGLARAVRVVRASARR